MVLFSVTSFSFFFPFLAPTGRSFFLPIGSDGGMGGGGPFLLVESERNLVKLRKTH